MVVVVVVVAVEVVLVVVQCLRRVVHVEEKNAGQKRQRLDVLAHSR